MLSFQICDFWVYFIINNILLKQSGKINKDYNRPFIMSRLQPKVKFELSSKKDPKMEALNDTAVLILCKPGMDLYGEQIIDFIWSIKDS